MNNVKFKGIIPALISPLNEDGTVREKVLRKLINWHLEKGCNGFYICGATGEGVVMKPEARKVMAEITVDAVKGKGFVIDHIGAIDFRTAMDLARHASDTGVDAISSLPPFFYKYEQKEIIQYYQALSDSSDVPILMYSLSLIGDSISKFEIVERIMKIKNIIGLKWTNYNFFEMGKIKSINDGNINVFVGNDEMLLAGLVMRADGGIGLSYNVMPKIYIELYRSFISGDIKRAQDAQFKANKVIDIMLRYNAFTAVKDILEMIGFTVGYYTFPIKRFTKLEQESFRDELKKINFEKEYL